jgi:tRNA (cmo5U34)-methyltransferase
VIRDDTVQEQEQPNGEESGQEEPSHARGYDDAIRSAIPAYELLHESVAAFLPGVIGEQATVLVVGAGTGEEIVHMSRANPGWRFVAEDPSAEMLEVAREKLTAAGAGDRVEFVAGLIEDVPQGERFEAATMILVQHFLPDDGAKLAILREVAARLRPGAPLFLANMHGDLAADDDQARYQAWKRRQMARGMAAEDAEAMFTGLPTVVHFVSEERTRELLREAGFTDIREVFRAFVIGGWVAIRQ